MPQTITEHKKINKLKKKGANMEQNKIIDFQILAQIIYFYDKIWEEEDNCYPDYRKIRIWERAIERREKKLNADEQMKKDIWETHCYLDRTYKEQADRLRSRGYIIVNNEKKD